MATIGIDVLCLLTVVGICIWSLFEFACAVGARLAGQGRIRPERHGRVTVLLLEHRGQDYTPAAPRPLYLERGAMSLEDERAWRLERGISHDAAWQADLEKHGRQLPTWAAPEAPRVGSYGFNSGACGASYGMVPYEPETVLIDPLLAVAPTDPAAFDAYVDGLERAPRDPAAFDAWLAGLVREWMRAQDKDARRYFEGE